MGQPLLMHNQNPFYDPPLSKFIKFLAHAMKPSYNKAILLIEVLFYTKNIISKRVQVDGAPQGEGLGWLDVLVAKLVDTPPLFARSSPFVASSLQLGITMNMLVISSWW